MSETQTPLPVHLSPKDTKDATVSVETGYAFWSESYDSFSNPMTYLVEKHLADLVAHGAHDISPVLELGCGTGRNLEHLMQMGASNGVGVDISEEMLAIARKRLEGTEITVQRHDLSNGLPLNDESFNTILISLVLEHIENIQPIFSEASRILAPNGQLVIFEIHPYQRLNGRRAHYKDGSGTDRFLPSYPHLTRDYVQAARQAGLILDRLEEYQATPDLIDEFPKLSRYGDTPIVLGLRFRCSE